MIQIWTALSLEALIFWTALISKFRSRRPPSRPATALLLWDALARALDRMEEQLPQFSLSAERAAKPAVASLHLPCFRGERSVVMEAYGRSGGLMGLDYEAVKDPAWNGALLYFLPHRLHRQEMQILKKRRGPLIALGACGRELEFAAARISFDCFLEIRRPEDDDLLPESLTGLAALWLWTAEFVGACRRLNNMPVIWQSIQASGGPQRAQSLSGRAFHEPGWKPLEAGQVARAYLNALRSDLAGVRGEIEAIQAAARLASESRRAYFFPFGHAVCHALQGPHDYEVLTNLASGWCEADWQKLRPQDFVLSVHYNALDGVFGQRAREAGARLAWSFSDPGGQVRGLIPPDEPFIDQHWAPCDAVVTLDDYDVPILPTSGVISCLILWMVQAEMLSLQQRLA